MKMQFVGAGASANKVDGQSSILVLSESGKRLLIDCGSYCWIFMDKMGLSPKDIDGVYISHLHADHVGGLEELAFLTYFNPALDRPKLYCNSQLMLEVWNKALSGGLESIQGKLVTLTEYFDCHSIENNGMFTWENIDFTPVQSIHVMSGYYVKYSYGLLIQERSEKKDSPVVFFTADTQFCPNQIKHFYSRADLIFQDCETAPYESGVHASYSELCTLEEDIRSKMVLYHYQTNPPQRDTVVQDGFIGFAEREQVFDITWKGLDEIKSKN
jgi:ribonuclease BN (tRNA processing enzyme)